jgi:hypothetical protein
MVGDRYIEQVGGNAEVLDQHFIICLMEISR